MDDSADARWTLPDPADKVLRATAALVARVFDAPQVFVLTQGHGTTVHLTSLYGPPESLPPDVVDLGPELAQASAGDDPIVMPDGGHDPRFPGWHPRLMLATASVRIPSDRTRRPMRLVVGDVKARPFEPAEIELLQGAAAVIGLLLDAEQARKAQAAVGRLVRFALESTDLDRTMQCTLDVVADVLDIPIVTVFRRLEQPGEFLVMADYRERTLKPGSVLVLPPEFDPQHAAGDALIVADWATERRLQKPEAVKGLGVEAFATANLLVEGHSWGRLTVGSPVPRPFTPADTELLQGIADVLAAAICRDEVEAKLRETAEAFQRALLPSKLPDVPGVEIAARYLPASGTLVGGDWFDVLDLPHGGVGLVIGDVEGHDSTAAAIMGQVRDLVRTYAGEGHSPSKIMGGVNRFLATHHDRLVTCCYLEVRPAELTLTGVRAGHPPPVGLAPDGTIEVLGFHGDPPLGVDENAVYREHTILLAPGATLLLATDGMVEDEDAAVETAARISGRDDPVEVLIGALVDEQRPMPHPDDIALVVARLAIPAEPVGHANGARYVRRVFGPFTESPAAARQFVRDILTAWGAADLVDVSQLAASELVTNALIHTTSSAALMLKSREPGRVWLGVGDDSDRIIRQPTASAEDVSGRGLAIVSLLADDWGVETFPGQGKTVWCTLSAAG